MRPTRHDSWFPYNDEPVYEPGRKPAGPYRPPVVPAPGASGRSGASVGSPVAGGMRGNAVTTPTWGADPQTAGTGMEPMPASSEFGTWEQPEPMLMLQDMTKEALMQKMMASVTREYY